MVLGETQFPGVLKIIETGKELNINYYNWQNPKFRESYWEALNYLINIAEKPLLVNVFSYKYLPNDRKDNIPSVNDIKKSQDKNIKDFLTGKKDVLFSTKFDRGISLDDTICRSIIMTKLPVPDLLDDQLILLKQYYGDFIYTKYINDMILREVLQNTGRVLRNKNDYASFYTIDRQLLKIIPYIWKGRKEIVSLSDKKEK
jgi:Rad3-related DNA helicase